MALVGWAEAERGARLGAKPCKVGGAPRLREAVVEQPFRRLAARLWPAWVGTEVGTESTADVPSCPLATFAKIAVLQEP